jgi:hypothetical protein
MSSRTTSFILLAFFAACGGKTISSGNSGNTGDQGDPGAGGVTGSATTGTGPIGIGSTGSGSTGTGSATTGTGVVTTSGVGGASGGTCGAAVCAPGWSCCNPSCGICAPPGGGCIEIACTGGTTGVGGSFIGGAGTTATNPGCVSPVLKPGIVTSTMISDLETGILVTGIQPPGGWFSYQDQEIGAVFVPQPPNVVTSSPGLNGTKFAVHAYGKGFMPPESATNWGGGVGIGLSVLAPGDTSTVVGRPTDLSAFSGISFWTKNGGIPTDINVMISTTDTDPNYCTCQATNNCYASHSVLITAPPNETKITIPFAKLYQPAYVANPIPFNPARALSIIFATNGPVPVFDFWVDEVALVK